MDYRFNDLASGVSRTDELCDPVLECIDFLLEYYITGVHEEAIDRFLTTDTKEFRVQDNLVFIFL